MKYAISTTWLTSPNQGPSHFPHDSQTHINIFSLSKWLFSCSLNGHIASSLPFPPPQKKPKETKQKDNNHPSPSLIHHSRSFLVFHFSTLNMLIIEPKMSIMFWTHNGQSPSNTCLFGIHSWKHTKLHTSQYRLPNKKWNQIRDTYITIVHPHVKRPLHKASRVMGTMVVTCLVEMNLIPSTNFVISN